MDSELRAILDHMRSDLAKLAARVERLEHSGVAAVEMKPESPEAALRARPAAEEGVSEETVLAISAAVAAYLGERVHIRQIRLISSSAWAQVGRAWIQASHHVH